MYEEILSDFKRYLSVEKGLSKNTEVSYLRDVKEFLDYCDKENLNFSSITKSEFEKYLFRLKNLGRKLSTLFRKTESIKAFYRFLLVENRIDKNPLSNFKAPKLERKLPQFLTIEEIKRIFESFSFDKFSSLRTAAVIDLLYSSGLRVSELCNLTMESVNLDQGWVRVIGKGKKERIVPISYETARLLKIYLDERQNIIFTKNKEGSPYFFVNRRGLKITRVQIWKDIKRFMNSIGIKKNVYPHILRHTFATHLLTSGADLRSISEMLGHSSLNTTQIYTHLDKTDIKNMHKRFHPKG